MVWKRVYSGGEGIAVVGRRHGQWVERGQGQSIKFQTSHPRDPLLETDLFAKVPRAPETVLPSGDKVFMCMSLEWSFFITYLDPET